MTEEQSVHTDELQEGIKRTRLSRMILMLVVATGILGAAGFAVYQDYQQAHRHQGQNEQQRLLAIVNTLADHIDGDQLEELLENNPERGAITGLQQNRTYDELHRILKEAKENNELETEIYTLTLRDDVGTKSLTNATFFGVSSAEKPLYREPYTPNKTFLDLYLTGGILEPYESENGTWTSALAPIRNSEDQVVAVLEADIQLNNIIEGAMNRFNKNLTYTLLFTGLFLVIALFMVGYITRRSLVAQRAVANNYASVNRTFTQLSDFADQIGKGNYEADTAPIENLDNTLSNALLQMKDNLQESRVQEQKRQWAIQGIAEFGDLLRENNQDVGALCQSAISKLAEYVGARQGIIYTVIENGSDPVLKPCGSYAVAHEALQATDVQKGEGLVGQTWANGTSTFLTDVPESFPKISSGLGAAQARSVLIVPLLHNEEVYGVLELSALKVLEEHEVDFVEKVALNIASTVSIVQINARTSQLLEEAGTMHEKFKMQEEEMRQNTEELKATQEEMQRRIKELNAQLKKEKGDKKD